MENTPAPEQTLPEPGMKWYNFLRFWLPFSGILAIVTMPIDIVLQLQMAATYTEYYTPAMTGWNIVQSVFNAGCGGLMLVAWRALVHRRERAPQLYMAQYAIYFFCSLVLTMVTNVAGGEPLYQDYMALDLVIAALFLWANEVYFRKRAHLFVN